MERRIIVENERVSNGKDFASNDNIEANTVAQEIVRSVDYPDCSDEKSQIVGCDSKSGHRNHRGKSNTKDAIVKDFALSHHTADFCKNNKFSLKAMESIMKECLIAIGAQAVINPTSYKQLKKEIFDCIPYSDWFSPESFPTTLRLFHQNNGLLF